jgi:thiamine-phosphate diphosphorylase
MDISGLHVITDGQLRADRSHVEIARAAIAGGAGIIQLRDKHADDGEFFAWATAIRKLTSKAGVTFIVNDRVDICLAVNADGVHVGQNDFPAKDARKLLGPNRILGVSIASLDELKQAEESGASYVGFGPVFDTATKADAGSALGLELLAEIKAAARRPVVAIGGIGLSNIESVADAGADGAAVISAVVLSEDMEQMTRRLAAAFASASGRTASPEA